MYHNIDSLKWKPNTDPFLIKDMIEKNQIENLGYLDNYVMYDSDLRPMEDFEKILTNFKSTS